MMCHIYELNHLNKWDPIVAVVSDNPRTDTPARSTRKVVEVVPFLLSDLIKCFGSIVVRKSR